MPSPPPDPSDPPERLDERARRLHERTLELEAVIARIREYVEPWKRDKRMKILGEMLLREIDRIEAEEAARTQREGRGASSE